MKDDQISHYQVVCIDDDLEFFQVLSVEAQNLGIKISLVGSLEEAKMKSEHQIITAHLINQKFLANSVFTESFQTLICQKLPSINQLQKLQKEKIQYVVGKPISSDEAHYLLSKICKLPNRLETTCDWKDEIPENLMKAYQQSTYEKVSIIEELIDKLKQSTTFEALENLKSVVHKIAGTSGFYGYEMASLVCKKLEKQLKENNIQDLDLETFYRQLFLYIQ